MTIEVLNDIQASIVRRLFEQDGLRFSQVNTTQLPTDQFSYHLRQLLKVNYIEKLPNQTYRLTAKGKQRAILLHPHNRGFIEQGFTAVVVVVCKKENGKTFYLLQERDRVPYRGLAAIPGDKVYYGESTENAAKRALELQTGLSGTPKLKSIWHIRDVVAEETVQDKFFYVYLVHHFEGEVKQTGITGNNKWMPSSQLKAEGVLHNTADIVESTLSDSLTYHEKMYVVSDY